MTHGIADMQHPSVTHGRPRISELSISELQARATEYRLMAATATTSDTRDALLRIAQRFANMAEERRGG
jgi:hypothetical protein